MLDKVETDEVVRSSTVTTYHGSVTEAIVTLRTRYPDITFTSRATATVANASGVGRTISTQLAYVRGLIGALGGLEKYLASKATGEVDV